MEERDSDLDLENGEATDPANDADRETVAVDRVVSLARSLLTKGGTLESTHSDEAIDRSELSLALEQHVLHNLPDSSIIAKTAAATGLANVESALSKTFGGASPSSLTDLEVASLEAIIEVTGRPAMRYANGKVEMPANLGQNGRWRVLVVTARHEIQRASASVGRIMVKGISGSPENVGTGWRLGEDLIVTNRHVARLIAENKDADPALLKLDGAKDPFIDFAATDNSEGSKRFSLSSIAYCAAEPLVDLALLRVGSGVADLPESLVLDWKIESAGRDIPGAEGAITTFKGKEVYVVGHPFKQRRSEAIASVFGTADGLKRWSPGIVLRIETGNPILQHDCSTLGGNSGSCVFTAGQHKVIGIHMGGVEVDELTDRGLANLAVAFARLDPHPAAKILRDGIV